MDGIGFRIADRIAQRLGLGRDAPERVQAGIRYLLSEAADEGHVYLPTVRTMELPAVGMMELPAVGMMERAVEILEINAELLPPALEALRANDGVVTEDLRCYLPPLHRAEVGAASSLKRAFAQRQPKSWPCPQKLRTSWNWLQHKKRPWSWSPPARC